MQRVERYRGLYPATPILVDWISNYEGFHAVEHGVFNFWRSALPLVKIVNCVLEGRMHRFSADAAIGQYNEEENTNLTFDEVASMSCAHIFSEAGEWVAFTESPLRLMLGGHDDPYQAIEEAVEGGVQWLILWLTTDNLFIVFASPHEGYREGIDWNDMTAEGLVPGDTPAALLPPEIEAAIRHELGVRDPPTYLGMHEHPFMEAEHA